MLGRGSRWAGKRLRKRLTSSYCWFKKPVLHRPVESGQFRAKRTQNLLRNNGLVGSMGRSYGAGDNASMESFFSLLQKNVLNTRRWDTRADLRLAMVTWIETKYNRRRRQRGLGKLTPAEFEMIYKDAEAA